MKNTIVNTTGRALVAAMLTAAAWHSFSALPPAKAAAVDDSQWRGGPSKEWFVNWDKALAEAKSTNKAMFLLNTGSDWCGWCKRLKANVLEKPKFIEFARKNLVLVYLDSPNRDPLPKDQKAHNRLITKSLPFGGGVPNALIMNTAGKKLGSIGGGGHTVDEYLAKLREILNGKVVASDSERLFSDGYSELAAEIAARRAALPPVKKNDFKATLTGVAVADKAKRYGSKNDIEFLLPEKKIEVPYGKTVLFRVEYDFPEGYGARVWVGDGICGDGKRHCWYFGSNPSGIYKGKGVAYGFLSLLDRGKTCNLKEITISTNADPELDDYPKGWTIGTFPVNITFEEKSGTGDNEGKQETDAPAVTKSVAEGWTEDFEAAKKQAAKEGKLILIDFSGSDWCHWCKKMDEEVFSKDEFIKAASKKYVLVMIDSPRDKSILSNLAKEQNIKLKNRYSVHGYPTVVIADPDGKEVVRHSGFRRGGPKGYMKELKALTKGVKWPKPKR